MSKSKLSPDALKFFADEGRKGGKKAADKLKSMGKLTQRAKKASAARWSKWLEDNPDKAAEALERRRKRKAAAKK